MIDIIFLIFYVLLLLLGLIYAGVITYHVFKYRYQLPAADAPKAIGALWIYLLVGVGLVAVSLIISFLYWWTT